MLVLQLKPRNSERPERTVKILVGDTEISVSAVEIKNGNVRVGFTAPKHVKIARQVALDNAGGWSGWIGNKGKKKERQG